MACTCLAVALTGLHPYLPTLVVVLLLANAAARLLMPAFRTDQSGNRFETVKGTIHMLLAVVAFGGRSSNRSERAFQPLPRMGQRVPFVRC